MFGRLVTSIFKFILIMLVLSFAALLLSKIPFVGYFIFVATVAFVVTKLVQKIKDK